MPKRRILILLLCAVLALILAMLFSSKKGADTIPAPPTANPSASSTVAPTPHTTARGIPEPTSQPLRYDGEFELPLQGATGYASIELNLRSKPSTSAAIIGTLEPGEGFRILGEEGSYWRVTDGETTGYAAHRYCMVNLPDVVPSIVYDNTNSYGSRILSSGKELEGVSGEGLYENRAYNPRFGEEEFIMPVLYTMAKKIHTAQQAALAEGNSLKIYEAYRPHDAQRKVVDALADLAGRDSAVNAGISTPPWKVSWFASQGTSHHQRGCAIDVSLVKADRTETRLCGPYAYENVTAFTEYAMPTAIHELSIAAAAFRQPVSSTSATAWRSAEPADGMNQAALSLQRYCADAGLTPLASEWWHFNDLEAYGQIQNSAGEGKFTLSQVYSAVPEG